MPTQPDNATPPAPWKRRSPDAVAGDGHTIQQVWSWHDDDDGGDRYVAIDGDVLVMGWPLEGIDDHEDIVGLQQESISLDALEAFLREAGWSIGRPT